MPRRGLEPPRPAGHWILDPARHDEEFGKCAVIVQFSTHGFSVHCSPVVKYKKERGNGAGPGLMVISSD